MSGQPASHEYLTPDEFEQIYKVPKSTQSSMRSRRQIPFVMMGRRMPRYRRSDVEAWLANRTVPAGQRRHVEPAPRDKVEPRTVTP